MKGVRYTKADDDVCVKCAKRLGDPSLHLVEKPSVRELKFMVEAKTVDSNMIPTNTQHFIVERAYFSTVDLRQSSRYSTHDKRQSNIQNNIVQGSCLEKGGSYLGECAHTYFRAGEVQSWISKKITKSGSRKLFTVLQEAKGIDTCRKEHG